MVGKSWSEKKNIFLTSKKRMGQKYKWNQINPPPPLNLDPASLPNFPAAWSPALVPRCRSFWTGWPCEHSLLSTHSMPPYPVLAAVPASEQSRRIGYPGVRRLAQELHWRLCPFFGAQSGGRECIHRDGLHSVRGGCQRVLEGVHGESRCDQRVSERHDIFLSLHFLPFLSLSFKGYLEGRCIHSKVSLLKITPSSFED